MDSLFYRESASQFTRNGIPQSLFEKKYPTVKSLLIGASKMGIIRAFRDIEKNAAAKPSAGQLRNIYTEALVEQLNKVFSENRILQQYLVLNNSDRITYFNSIIRVQKDGSLLVQENISIHNGNGSPGPVYGNDAELTEAGMMNNEIKRGIVRTFPLYYVNRYKLFQNTSFKLKEVLRDGKAEKYHTEDHENGILLYTGSRDVYIDPGQYTYRITYETGHQLKFLNKYDELYWNVTGNGWSFRIDSAQCTVILPKGAEMLSGKCYTGFQSSTDEDCSMTKSVVGDSTYIVFKTSRALMPNQGLTIAVSWPKGFVTTPSFFKQAWYFTWNNKAVFFLPLAALFSALFCFVFWRRYGRDPEKGVVYPQFQPPAGFSPAALGYIYYQKFDRQLTAATLVDAAVRNKIRIDVEREGFIFKHNEYHILKSDKAQKPPLSAYEEFESDVQDLIDTTIEKGKYNSDLGSLNTAVEKYCESKYKNKDGTVKKNYKGFFALNNTYTTIPILVCLVAAIWGFFGGLVKSLRMFNFWQIAYFIAGILLCSLVLRIFSNLLKAYSPEGRKLADKIEGFRMFLSTADEKRFDAMNPPKKSLELYEKYLPFAIALGCEIEWGQKFEDIINSAYLDGKATTSFSQSIGRDSRNFSSSFASSFGGAISSASSPPSSSSGGGSSFGGGSSGGGGGGGGGGGW